MKILKEHFGNIYYTFDDPISAKEFFGDKLDRSVHSMGPLHMKELTQYEKNFLPPLAYEIVSRQQRCTVLTVFNLASVIINHNLCVEGNLEVDYLKKEIHWLKNVMESFGAFIQAEVDEKGLEEAFVVHKNLITLNTKKHIQLVNGSVNQGQINPKKWKAHVLSDETMTKSVPFIMLQIYINPILYYVVDGAILVTILSRKNKLTKGKFLSKTSKLF